MSVRERAQRCALRRSLGAAVAMALAVAALLGVLATTALAAPDAALIDSYLAQHGSPMLGSGAAFAAEGQAHGVDPALLVAIAGAESSFGRFLYSRDGDQCTFNAFNWFYGPTWPASDFTSWDEATAAVAKGLAGELYYGAGLYSVEAIAPRYCPDGTAAWIANVTTFLLELGGDPDDTRLAPSPAAEPSAAAALRGTVEIAGGARVVGGVMRATVNLVNRGDRPASFEGLFLAVRGPAGVAHDLVAEKAFTLAPGQTVAVEARWPLDLAGRWRGWVEVRQGGQSTLVGARPAFTYRVSLPRRHAIRRWSLHDESLTTLFAGE